MRVDVIMPQMGESIAEGTLTKWLKKAGDKVARDEPIFEISTDKVDAEIPSPAAGVLADIKVGEGQTVPINTIVALIETDAGAAAGAEAPASKPAPAAKTAPVPAAKQATAPPPAPAPSRPSTPPARGAAPGGSGVARFVPVGVGGPGAGVRARRAGVDRPDDHDAQADRRAHDPVAAHLGARHHGVRGRHAPHHEAARREPAGVRGSQRRAADRDTASGARRGRGPQGLP